MLKLTTNDSGRLSEPPSPLLSTGEHGRGRTVSDVLAGYSMGSQGNGFCLLCRMPEVDFQNPHSNENGHSSVTGLKRLKHNKYYDCEEQVHHSPRHINR